MEQIDLLARPVNVPAGTEAALTGSKHAASDTPNA
jgi:hypothetical protein